jgi:hypothetical protein
MTDRDHLRRVGDVGRFVLGLEGQAKSIVTVSSRWRAGFQSELAADPQPDLGALGAGPGRDEVRHPREHVLDRQRLADPLRELRQHLVRSRALAVDEPVGEAARPVAERLEDQRDDRDRREHQDVETGARVGHEVADADHEADVDEGDEAGEDREDDGLLDHDVEVVEPVFQDRDATCRGDAHHERGDEEAPEDVLEGGVAPQEGLAREERDEHDEGERAHDGEPSELLTLLALGAAEPEDEPDEARDPGHDRDDRADGDQGARDATDPLDRHGVPNRESRGRGQSTRFDRVPRERPEGPARRGARGRGASAGSAPFPRGTGG